MNPVSSILGVFAVLGTWPNWERYFDLSRRGQKLSFVILALSLAPLWVVAYGIQVERAQRLGTDLSLPTALPFILIVGLWLFTFPGLAYLIAMILAQKVAGFEWGTAVLIGCVIVAVGLTFILLAISR